MARPTLFILNPASAAGSTGRRVEALRRRVEASLGPVDLQSTSAPGEATRLARAASEAGVERILVGGGDGTTSEVVAGVLEAAALRGSSPTPVLGLLPLGSGLDLMRSLGLPRALGPALDVIAEGSVRTIDAGRIELRDPAGRPVSRAFVNEASLGLSGETVMRVGRTSKRIGPRLGFVAGAVGAILGHRPVDVAVEVDGSRVFEGPVSLLVAANGRFFGAGMRVAPGAVLDDGRLELVLVRGLSMPRLLVNLPSFYLGRHGRHPNVSFRAVRSVVVLPKEGSAPVEVDGEAVGGLPMRAEVVPGAIRVHARVEDAAGSSLSRGAADGRGVER